MYYMWTNWQVSWAACARDPAIRARLADETCSHVLARWHRQAGIDVGIGTLAFARWLRQTSIGTPASAKHRHAGISALLTARASAHAHASGDTHLASAQTRAGARISAASAHAQRHRHAHQHAHRWALSDLRWLALALASALLHRLRFTASLAPLCHALCWLGSRWHLAGSTPLRAGSAVIAQRPARRHRQPLPHHLPTNLARRTQAVRCAARRQGMLLEARGGAGVVCACGAGSRRGTSSAPPAGWGSRHHTWERRPILFRRSLVK